MHRNWLKTRFWVQFIVTVITNSYFKGFVNGSIFTGASKQICVPSLNCYSCPGALFACPIGALQVGTTSSGVDVSEANNLSLRLSAMFSSFPMLAVGFLSLIGLLVGRAVCGWGCPFGLFQEALNKIPSVKFVGPKIFRYFKYVVLIVFVFLLPALWLDDFGFGEPYFCKLICPSGTLMGGLPLIAVNQSLRAQLGRLFLWKVIFLAAITIGSVFIRRPFCRWFCPLGAFYGPFNKISLLKISCDHDKCIECGLCSKVCPVNIDVPREINTAECLKCFDCKKVCPKDAIVSGNFINISDQATDTAKQVPENA